MAGYSRTDRISEEVRRELASIIRDMKDPRIPIMTSVIKVSVTKDLKFAKASISIMGDEKTKKDAFAALKAGSGFIRREIGHRLNLRNTPEFTFVEDNSIEYGAHIDQILKGL